MTILAILLVAACYAAVLLAIARRDRRWPRSARRPRLDVSPVLARCHQADDIAWAKAMREESGRLRLPLPAPDETPLPTTRGGAA
jgi:hypothetical protein